MYDKAYAEAWIRDYESGEDIYRAKYIMPFLKNAINNAPENGKILDVGCGWGIAIPYLTKNQHYYGVDITPDFFPYIKSRYKHKLLTLRSEKLPELEGVEDNSFDLVICSMTLHAVSDWKTAIKNLSLKIRPGGKLVIVDFTEYAKSPIKKRFRGDVNEEHCKGMYTLDCGIEVESEVFFHKQDIFMNELKRHGLVVKKDLGPVFVGYEVTPYSSK